MAHIHAISRQSHSPHAHRVMVLALLLMAFALRLYALGNESLWYDELVSVDLAAAPVIDLISQTARDIHPPGYYLLLHIWRQLSRPVMEMGYSFEFIYAFPSAILGVMVCALVYALARRFFSTRVAWLALLLVALHPYHISYGQEVRMYTLGALLCLLYFSLSYEFTRGLSSTDGTHTKHGQANSPHTDKLLPQLGFLRRRFPLATLSLAIVTAAGLYTFYYFIFLIAALAPLMLWGWLVLTPRPRRLIHHWTGAHLIALILWLPWLPTFVRQVLNPPVPAWRESWQGLSETGSALLTTLTVYLTGHAFESQSWIGGVLLILGALVAIYRYAKPNRASRIRQPSVPALPIAALACFAVGPPLLIIALSATVTPLFHPRYLYVYHTPFLILLALCLVTVAQHFPRVGTGFTIGLAAFLIWGTVYQWTDPAFRADDHRGAVAQIARDWRPGHIILVNAGWAYRALNVYWPTRVVGPDSALPPSIGAPLRLDHQSIPELGRSVANPYNTVTLLRTGSVDGPATLGWGNPDADFFGITAQETVQSLDMLISHATHIWHYRIYDTVSDPNQVIRTWLTENATQLMSEPVPGRDFLRLERYALHNDGASLLARNSPHTRTAPELSMQFGDTVRLLAYQFQPEHQAGAIYYMPLRIESTEAATTTVVGTSLRLVDVDGAVHAQGDRAITLTEEMNENMETILAMPLPAGLWPGAYNLELIVYDTTTLAPLTATGNLPISASGSVHLGEVQIHARPDS